MKRNDFKPERTHPLWIVCILVVFVALHAGLLSTARAETTAPGSQLMCLPKPFGTGVQPTLRTNVEGMHGWWFCSDGYDWWLTESVVGWEVARNAANLAMFQQAIASPDPLKQMQGYLRYSRGWDHPTVQAIWKPQEAERASTKVPPSLWVVSLNGKQATRPTYLVVDGKRATKASGTTPVTVDGQRVACDMGTRFAEGRSVYGVPVPPVASTPSIGTVATLQPIRLTLCVRR